MIVAFTDILHFLGETNASGTIQVGASKKSAFICSSTGNFDVLKTCEYFIYDLINKSPPVQGPLNPVTSKMGGGGREC